MVINLNSNIHNVVTIIQARMNSKRLPGKVLLEVEGKKMLELMIERVRFSKYANKIVVATTKNILDDKIASFCKINKIDCYRGSEIDVLDRIYKCATKFNADHIVRLTADNPIQEPSVMDKIISEYSNNINTIDYASNTIVPTWPDGFCVEIFSYKSLKYAWDIIQSSLNHH